MGLSNSKVLQLSPPSPRRVGIDFEHDRGRDIKYDRHDKERDRSRERDRDYHPDMDRIRDRDRDRHHKRHHNDSISPKRKKQPKLKPDLKLKCGACGQVCFHNFNIFITTSLDVHLTVCHDIMVNYRWDICAQTRLARCTPHLTLQLL